MKFIAEVCEAFFARQRPVSTNMKPACMNITRKPATSVQTKLMEYRLCATRSYTSVIESAPGTSPLASPAGVAHTPVAPPVGSGQVGFAGSALVPVKYPGRCGGSAAAVAALPGICTMPDASSRPPIRSSRLSRSRMSVPLQIVPSECVWPSFARPDPHDVLDRRHEDLAVTDAARPRRLREDADDGRRHRVVEQHLDADLRQEVDHVLRTAIELGVPLLAPESLHLRDGEALDTRLRERLLHLVELERLDDRLDLLHRPPRPCTLQSGGQRDA